MDDKEKELRRRIEEERRQAEERRRSEEQRRIEQERIRKEKLNEDLEKGRPTYHRPEEDD